jgi:hypothetical protein
MSISVVSSLAREFTALTGDDKIVRRTRVGLIDRVLCPRLLAVSSLANNQRGHLAEVISNQPSASMRFAPESTSRARHFVSILVDF